MSLPDRPLTRREIEYLVEKLADGFARDLGITREKAAPVLYSIIVAFQERGITVVQAAELLKEPKKLLS